MNVQSRALLPLQVQLLKPVELHCSLLRHTRCVCGVKTPLNSTVCQKQWQQYWCDCSSDAAPLLPHTHSVFCVQSLCESDADGVASLLTPIALVAVLGVVMGLVVLLRC